MRLCQPEFALDHVWHILEILEGSPAESAGLVPFGDWVVGWSGGVLGKEGDFYDVIEQVRRLCVLWHSLKREGQYLRYYYALVFIARGKASESLRVFL